MPVEFKLAGREVGDDDALSLRVLLAVTVAGIDNHPHRHVHPRHLRSDIRR